MADAEAVMAAVPRRGTTCSYIGLVLNRRGFDRAVAAGVDEVNCVVVASETFSQRNQGSPWPTRWRTCAVSRPTRRRPG